MDVKISSYYSWLNGIRAILCIWVVLYHYTCRYAEIFNQHTNGLKFEMGGAIGVCCFFIITGYLTQQTLPKYFHSKIKWLMNKYFRLWPAYSVCIIFIYIILNIYNLPERGEKSFVDLLKDLPMLPYLSGNIENATWYVMAIVKYYILIFCIARFQFLNKNFFYIIVFLLFIVSFIWSNTIIAKMVRTLLGEFPLYFGMFLFNTLNSNNRNLKLILLILMGVFLTIFYSYYPLFFILICLYFLFDNRCQILQKILSNKVLDYIGGKSYVWYLVHQNIGYVILTCLIHHYGYQLYFPYFVAIATLVLAVLLDQILIKQLNNYIKKYIL